MGAVRCVMRRLGYMSLFVFLLGAAVSAQRSVTDPVDHYYRGAIGELPVQVKLTIRPDSVSGYYYDERVGVPLALEGELSDEQEATLRETDEEGQLTGRWEVSFSISPQGFGDALMGSWHSPDGEQSVSVDLSKIAEYVTLSERQGVMLESESHYPFFLTGGMGPVNRRLRENVQWRHQEFFGEGQEYAYAGELFNAWWRSERTELHDYADDVVSMFISVRAYTGGAHDSLHFLPANYHIVDGEAHELSLADLFLPDAPYQETLSDYLMEELEAREAGWLMMGTLEALDEEMMRVFTFSPSGLEFAFAPYEVGSWAEGPYFVNVPFEAVAAMIDPEGPLGRFVE